VVQAAIVFLAAADPVRKVQRLETQASSMGVEVAAGSRSIRQRHKQGVQELRE
jgi:hypothetical protein